MEILKVEKLVKTFSVKKGFFGKYFQIKPLDEVSFSLREGETLGVVGESGCGKTTLGRTVIKLQKPDGGKIFFDGNDVTDIPEKDFQKYRRNIQIVFQDPFSSLNPRMTVYETLARPIRIHKTVPKSEEKKTIVRTLESVGLKKEHMNRFPHEFSGGQRQRIAIARAIITRPKFIVLDEPTSALDVSVQAQIINLLKKLKKDLKLTYMFISHDLSVIKFLSDRVAVMYLGQIVEMGKTDLVINNMLHPYTELLFNSVPIPDPAKKMNFELDASEVPSLINSPAGCPFFDRCHLRLKECNRLRPKLEEVEKDHLVACFLYHKTVHR
ncbi:MULTISPECIES: ABC transporter ATP-binding protein [Pseudothermotoga]|uniref:Oligopeptide/dipeptide ABC transporter, ATPase subunit n=1 Tax=Pseudothermotoga lettingae (strain ATCC BAA-301 / DSM 14385 / NBRC 107922 / TMO) TaxID=416591 RepID=A8F3N4_PSELT|nr:MULTISPECIES: ABC transporter ATP-binding protein [Pseudothermotoga]ABV32768.1 oligopeptide/dipeptide ABC transporter, ATPase subunit [Pseudothermotoga lettingae TMO]KUK20760.1 MAG: Oligopeptide/dipeptide ABC transporter, ATPase subunit [Pseudothermotoga lettingae]MDK2885223.1 peptide/nickel transport system ATP-binding protein [Pseudothermotoga sp.]GLI48238.1 ABC transporter ATP-binding protein [Pseudothermotoga lettingae TMO]HBJ80919.1 ABC transporter ATP-binding protein [Pseudothermotoga